jgi:hypothetical protein
VLSGTPRTFIGSTTFAVRGLADVADSGTLVRNVAAIVGVESVVLDLAGGIVTVRAGEPVDRADVATAVSEAGFTVAP